VVAPVIAAEGGERDGMPAATRALTSAVLDLLKAWLADARLAGSSLTVLTRGAVAAGEHERSLDLTQAPIWGLVRTAQSENPTARLRLIDLDGAARQKTRSPCARVRFGRRV
jgi:hypothetical protein